MKKVTKQEWLNSLMLGDIGLNYSKNPFSWLQQIYRKRMKEGPHKASHGWFVYDPPYISEANGMIVKGPTNKPGNPPTVIKYIGGKTKTFVFRYLPLNIDQLAQMQAYARAAEETGGHYSIGGIWGFAKSFFGKKTSWKDTHGVFCTEYTSRIILAGNIKEYIDRDPWEISPSYQLNWFMGNVGVTMWALCAMYDGNGEYYIRD